MRLAEGTIVWSRAAKNSVKARRSSWLCIRATLPAGLHQLGPPFGLALPHGGPSLLDRGPQVATEVTDGRREILGHPLGRVAGDGLAHAARHPERHAEAEPEADHQPEQPLEHARQSCNRRRRKRRAARPVPDANANVLMTGFEKAR